MYKIKNPEHLFFLLLIIFWYTLIYNSKIYFCIYICHKLTTLIHKLVLNKEVSILAVLFDWQIFPKSWAIWPVLMSLEELTMHIHLYNNRLNNNSGFITEPFLLAPLPKYLLRMITITLFMELISLQRIILDLLKTNLQKRLLYKLQPILV